MVLILPEHSQRPYRYGMTLLCIGAMFNWLGLADNNAEPVRYIGVTLIAAGAMLICLAMCFWMKATHDPQVAALQAQAEQEAVHHIVAIRVSEAAAEKPPDYDTVTGALPPSYEDAVKQTQTTAQTTSQPPADELDGVAICNTKPESEQPQESTSGECSVPCPQEGSFGLKVLRISKRLLGRTRSHDSAEGIVPESAPPPAGVPLS